VEVLDGVIGRALIDQACREQHVGITEKELDAEVARAAALMLRPLRDGSPDVQGFLKMTTEKQGVTAEIYRHDSVWPSVALRTAQEVWDMARRQPTVENFSDLAEKYSIEGTSRSLKGEVPPIGKHSGQPELEKEAFSLKKGEISGVIQVGDKFVILYCKGYTKPLDIQFAEVRSLIEDDIREKKTHLEMASCFEQLQESATIDNFLAGKSQAPTKSEGLLPADQRLPTLRMPASPGNG
jgi:hypothetical protein